MKSIIESIVLPIPTEKEIINQVKYWGISLPETYKKFILKYNGGIPRNPQVICNREKYLIRRFLCILEDARQSEFGEFDISVVQSHYYEYLTNDENAHTALLPFAITPFDDLFCFDYRKATSNPTVFLWNCFESQEFLPVGKKVCNSFDEFLSCLNQE